MSLEAILESLKEKKLDTEIYPAFNKAKQQIVWFNGLGYDCSPEDTNNWLTAVRMAEVAKEEAMALGEEEKPLYYKVWLDDKNKAFLPTSLETLLAVGCLVRDQQTEAYARLEELRGALELAKTIADIKSVTW